MTYGNVLDELSMLEELLTKKTIHRLPFVKTIYSGASNIVPDRMTHRRTLSGRAEQY
jgi:hypothetical protein